MLSPGDTFVTKPGNAGTIASRRAQFRHGEPKLPLISKSERCDCPIRLSSQTRIRRAPQGDDGLLRSKLRDAFEAGLKTTIQRFRQNVLFSLACCRGQKFSPLCRIGLLDGRLGVQRLLPRLAEQPIVAEPLLAVERHELDVALHRGRADAAIFSLLSVSGYRLQRLPQILQAGRAGAIGGRIDAGVRKASCPDLLAGENGNLRHQFVPIGIDRRTPVAPVLPVARLAL